MSSDPLSEPGAQQVNLFIGLRGKLRRGYPVISASSPNLRRERIHPSLLSAHVARRFPGGGADD